MPDTSSAGFRPEELPALVSSSWGQSWLGSLVLARGGFGFTPRTHCPQATAQSLRLLLRIIGSGFQGCLGLKCSSNSVEEVGGSRCSR